MMKRIQAILILALVAIYFSACETPTPVDQVPPEVPPMEMFTVPSSVVEDTDADTTRMGATYYNWLHAGINLLVWNTAIAANVSLPVAAFGRALDETPVYIGNGTFEWTYSHTAAPIFGGKTYLISLTAEYLAGGQEVEWIMTTSEVGGFTNFVWYSGISKVDFSEAHFTTFHKPNNPEPYMDIDYVRDANDDFEIRYTNVNPSNNGIGGYLEYRTDSGSTLNRAFDIIGGPNFPNNMTEIEWNETTVEGRVRDFKRFNDNDWHCWDDQQIDVDC